MKQARPWRHVILFQNRFVEAIARGTKVSTIRLARKRAIQSGDWLDLRHWTGAPYRSPQEFIKEVTCASVHRIELLDFRKDVEICVWTPTGSRNLLDRDELDQFANHEGFEDWPDMKVWFFDRYDTPLVAQLITWGRIEICGRRLV